QIRPAGDVDGDGTADILLTGLAGGFLVFGGNLADASFTDLLTPPSGPIKALALPTGEFRGIGDFNGDGVADLAAATLVSTDKLNEGGEVVHQVVHVYLGGPRAGLATASHTPAAQALVLEA